MIRKVTSAFAAIRAKAAWAVGAGLLASTTLQALDTMFIIDPSDDAQAMSFVWPFFAYLALIPFVIAAYVFEHPKDD